MLPLRAKNAIGSLPIITITILCLNVLIYFWDRQFALSGQSVTFADLGMRPSEVVDALNLTAGRDRFALVTLFTSIFLHSGLLHLIGNLIYLFTFGPRVEAALGSWRYTLYYLFWGVVASATHIFVDPGSTIPTIGASGAIGGVLGAYFLLFPTSKIDIIIPLIPIPFVVSTWALLGGWFLYQIFVDQPGVATWAHAGGFLAGMVTVLIMGGRTTILKGREEEFNDEDDE